TERPGDFRCTDVAGYLTTRTTGTTGRPAEIWLSRYEMELWPALGALAGVLRDELRTTDVMQVNPTSTAVVANHLAAAPCRLLDTETGEPPAPGALGTVVLTPYFPYRDCMPVFRYDTRDVARCLPDEPLTCDSAATPAIGQILGKADHLLRLRPGEVITPRQL